jgi:hypothetical protein
MRNPVSEVSPPRIGAREMDTPDREEIEEVLHALAGRRMAARWILGLMAGPRQGEVLGLMWPEVDIADPEDATVTIAWELARLPWQHGCEDPQACGGARHRWACPPRGCTRHRHRPCCAQDCTRRGHVCKRPCPADCRVHRHEEGCKHNCSRRSHVCPRFCAPGCTKHGSACPRRKAGGLVLKPPKSEKSKRTGSTNHPAWSGGVPLSRRTSAASER